MMGKLALCIFSGSTFSISTVQFVVHLSLLLRIVLIKQVLLVEF